jgi:DNA-binding TFAR19-related protein (PDSD5 family)
MQQGNQKTQQQKEQEKQDALEKKNQILNQIMTLEARERRFINLF